MFAKLGAEVLELTDLVVAENNRLFPMGFLEEQQAVVFGEQVITLPHTARTYVDTLQSQFLRDLKRTVGRFGEGV